jgi:Amt family ammonium transporter
MHASAMRRLEIARELALALEGGLFVVHYQPIVSLGTGRIEGFEALVRMRSAARGLIGPAEFIHIAEETGAIGPMLETVLTESARQIAAWRATHPHLYVSVNVSGQLFRPELVELVEGALQSHALSPEGLKLELTESVLVEAGQVSSAILDGLQRLGVGLCIDDFGTGYSSLSYLHQFSIDRLKIDKSFVAALDGARMPGIVRTVIDLSRSLSVGVTAEGIETAAQLEALRALGCTSGQGWHFAKALPADEASALLECDPVW